MEEVNAKTTAWRFQAMMYEKQESGMPWEAQKANKEEKRLILGECERTKRAEVVDLVVALGS